MNVERPISAVVAAVGLVLGFAQSVGQFQQILNQELAVMGALALGIGTVSFLLSPVLVFSLGYWAGGKLDVPEHYDRLALVFGAVGGVAFLGGMLAVVLVASSELQSQHVGLLVVTSTYNAAIRAVDFAITGVAGAAIAYFRTRA
ncbi:hypothetical protein [Halorussus halophilus]|uniref:hypothetical protein n=1 Tax=Halorussus halophilus TaxID=2650975 RepID=UPI0013016791|nr:hypothetical protein [Halorussus halophilus]